MSLTLDNLGNKYKQKKRVGRGNASGHGSFSTRGIKGQRARSGGKRGLRIKGFKKTLLGVPKFKGMVSHYPKSQPVQLSILDKHFEDGSQVTPGVLYEKKLINKLNGPVKILKDVEKFEKKLDIFGCELSERARELVEKAGGKLIETSAIKEGEPKQADSASTGTIVGKKKEKKAKK
ncbi:MAG: 50S ribosomal protein L15 [Parcubacteria group bacterium]